jgi:hypothetical protein
MGRRKEGDALPVASRRPVGHNDTRPDFLREGDRMRRCWPLLLLLAAPAPAAEPAALARYDAAIRPAQRAHWAYRPVRAPTPPAVKDRAWARNPIDAFVLAPLEARGWRPAPPASRRALARRLHLDLTGLPPTPEEVDDFLTDERPDAYERLVDRLLASPHHGERWARHWLDVARYADTNAYERDADKPFAWRYRDWVISALNADKPFDRFALEQLAGDELPDADGDTVIATGFLRLGPWDDEPADPVADRFDQLDDLVVTTAESFLGLTLGCARCHNHPFEALTAHDYYRAVAVFAPLERPRRGRTELDLPALPPRLRATLGPKDRRLLRAPRGYFLEERSPKAPPTHLLRRGKPGAAGPEVRPGMPAVLVARQPDFLPPDAHTTRRRLTFARWVASGDNPLTARVIVNRVWQHHFGQGLVRTPGDFGTRGERPTHPELLDWLADWFVREGWSLKKLHRLIVTSNTYRMSRRSVPESAACDPENRLLWRAPYRRLEAEAVRDSVLAVSGRLNRAFYGPGVRPPIPAEALAGHSDPKTVWRPSPADEAARRTVYVHVKRSLLVPLVESLDFCDTARSASRRAVTTVAPQALTLFNGDFVNEQARHLADRLEREAGADPSRQVEWAYRLALARPPAEAERARVLAFLRERRAEGTTARAALEQLCRVLFNLNEFVYPD